MPEVFVSAVAAALDERVRPPLGLAINALNQARACGRRVYLAATETGWRMVASPHGLPDAAAVWEFPANRYDAPRPVHRGR